MKTEFKLRPIVYEGIDFDDYKFNIVTNEVIGIYGRTLKHILSTWGYYFVGLQKDKKRHFIYLHRLVYQMHNKDEDIKPFIIDHKDRNKLNNNIDNLRKATYGENSQNRTPRGKSKYIGVTWNKQHQKWYAYYNDGTRKHIGLYMTEIECAHAYDETILRLGLNNGFRPLNRDIYPDEFKILKNLTKENNIFNKMVRKKVIHVVQTEPVPEPEIKQVDPVEIEIKQVDPVKIEDIHKNKEVTIQAPEKIEEPEKIQEANEPKKGRGRPKKPKQEPIEPVERPKRGRPRKEKPENPEPPREKQKRGPKPTDKGRVALGVNGYGKVYYKENAYDINRKRLIREIEKGYEPTDKMLIKYNIT
jgi:hypothetical protein